MMKTPLLSSQLPVRQTTTSLVTLRYNQLQLVALGRQLAFFVEEEEEGHLHALTMNLVVIIFKSDALKAAQIQ